MTVFNFIFLELGKQRGQIDGEAFSFGEERFGGLFDLGLGDGFFGGVGDGVKSLLFGFAVRWFGLIVLDVFGDELLDGG